MTPDLPLHSNAAFALRSFVNRLERLEDDKAALAADVKELLVDAKSQGFDTKALRAVVRRRRGDRAQLEMFEQIVELYEGAIESPASGKAA